ncbi:hypothetical protein J6590_077292 [Homalodisca vitripennis]|nr:hypothetical protein J6590_077292 [Homalodisca vitripennis]
MPSEPPPMTGHAACLQGQNNPAVTHQRRSHSQRCVIWLSCNNHGTRYTSSQRSGENRTKLTDYPWINQGFSRYSASSNTNFFVKESSKNHTINLRPLTFKYLGVL